MYAFLSVVAICAAALVAFRWWLNKRPAITPEQYASLVQRIEPVERAVKGLSVSRGFSG